MMKTFHSLLATSLLLVSTSTWAEVTQDCIFTGQVKNSANPSEVRVKFNDVQAGGSAPCRLMRGNSRARVEFKAKPDDDLQSLPTGTAVQYRYQRRNGQDLWQRVDTRASDI